jgi:hypothetical protein
MGCLLSADQGVPPDASPVEPGCEHIAADSGQPPCPWHPARPRCSEHPSPDGIAIDPPPAPAAYAAPGIFRYRPISARCRREASPGIWSGQEIVPMLTAERRRSFKNCRPLPVCHLLGSVRGLVGAGARGTNDERAAWYSSSSGVTPKMKLHGRLVIPPSSDEGEVSMVEKPVLTPHAYRPKSSCRQSMGFAAERPVIARGSAYWRFPGGGMPGRSG